MKGRGNGQQNLAGEKKEKPDQRQGEQALEGADGPFETAPGRERRRGRLRQAGRTENAAVVLGHAFPAEKPPTARTAGGGLTVRMMKAATLDDRCHGGEPDSDWAAMIFGCKLARTFRAVFKRFKEGSS